MNLVKCWPLLFLSLAALAQTKPEVKSGVKKSAETENITPTELEPLSEEFLLFLAQMEEVDGQWMHPVDVAQEELEEKKDVAEQTPSASTQIRVKRSAKGKDDDNQ